LFRRRASPRRRAGSSRPAALRPLRRQAQRDVAGASDVDEAGLKEAIAAIVEGVFMWTRASRSPVSSLILIFVSQSIVLSAVIGPSFLMSFC
jgi:hypothetical protein